MDLARIRPIGDRVLVRRDAMMSQTPGGIWTPESWGRRVHPHAFRQDEPIDEASLRARYKLSGEVVACGPGGWSRRGERVTMQLTPGMRVLMLDEGEDVELGDGHEYVCVREDDCIAEETP